MGHNTICTTGAVNVHKREQLTHSTTNVHVSYCHVIYLAFIGHWDTLITSLSSLSLLKFSISRVIMLGPLILVQSAISLGQVLLIFPRSLPTYHASRHVQANQASCWYVLSNHWSFSQRTIPEASHTRKQVSYPLFHSLVCNRVFQVIPTSRITSDF